MNAIRNLETLDCKDIGSIWIELIFAETENIIAK